MCRYRVGDRAENHGNFGISRGSVGKRCGGRRNGNDQVIPAGHHILRECRTVIFGRGIGTDFISDLTFDTGLFQRFPDTGIAVVKRRVAQILNNADPQAFSVRNFLRKGSLLRLCTGRKRHCCRAEQNCGKQKGNYLFCIFQNMIYFFHFRILFFNIKIS